MAIDIKKAAKMCADVAENYARWGKHAGFGDHSAADVLEAMRLLHNEGVFTYPDEHEARVLANRQKAAAEARATKYKAQLDEAKAELDALRQEFEDYKQEIREKVEAVDAPKKGGIFTRK